MAEATKRLSQSANEALDRATNGQALTNYPAIFEGFLAKGIAEADIKPRENVFTFQAWKAVGRSVRKGEHGVRIVTFVLCESKQRDPSTGEEKVATYRRPHTDRHGPAGMVDIHPSIQGRELIVIRAMSIPASLPKIVGTKRMGIRHEHRTSDRVA